MLDLLGMLRHCCVVVYGTRTGTGFFVAPGKVLTCAHVVGANYQLGDNVTLKWMWNQELIARVVELLTDGSGDIAILELVDASISHPCVHILAPTNIGDDLYGYGFPKFGKDLSGDGIQVQYESETILGSSRGLRYRITFKGGNVDFGFSGGPLLNLQTGGVIGIISESRGVGSDIGGWAIPISYVLDRFPYIASANIEYHHRNTT